MAPPNKIMKLQKDLSQHSSMPLSSAISTVV